MSAATVAFEFEGFTYTVVPASDGRYSVRSHIDGFDAGTFCVKDGRSTVTARFPRRIDAPKLHRLAEAFAIRFAH